MKVSEGSVCRVASPQPGVYWLHLRLDTRPKYYTHAPFRAAP